jgi:indolepyruvate ferredoxin oxidoreductase
VQVHLLAEPALGPDAEALATQAKEPTDSRHLSQTLDEVIERRAAFLADYQNAAYAERYRASSR